MCGIHLIWGKGANEESIQEMLDISRHRGPDQKRTYSPWPGLWIGVNRLKILHPGPDADQPFWSPDSRSLLIWNGEIYNFLELRDTLKKMGTTFITQSDTEVLLHWLRIFGPKGLEKLEGMFALFYVDLIDNSVLVARDKNGEKPLFFSQNQNQLVLSSEVKGIAKLKKSRLDFNQLEHYFCLRAPLLGKTFYRGVKEWKPARLSVIKQHNTFRWDNIGESKKVLPEPDQKGFREMLEQTISRQFHADVPVGLQLSGGADSSLLYALWYRQTGTQLPTYTIQTEKKYRKKYADGDAAQRFEKQIPSEQHLVNINQEIFWENWDSYLESLDHPIGDSASFLTWLIGKEAKKKVKVLISGAGADELWGGYNRHRAFAEYLKRPNFLVNYQNLLQKIPLGRAYQKFMESLSPNANRTFLNFSSLCAISEDLALEYERVFNTKLSPYRKVLDFDRQVYLVQDVLKIQDNALMAHGIEGRSPYLDTRMVDFWKQVKGDEPLMGKPWIKDTLNELGLNWISKRSKFGFGLPLAEWLSEPGEFKNRIFKGIQEFEATHGDKFPEKMSLLAKNPEAGVKDHFLILYNLFLLGEWLKLQQQ